MSSFFRWTIAIVGCVFLIIIYALWRDLDKVAELSVQSAAISGGIRGAIIFGGIYLLYKWAKNKKETEKNNEEESKTTASKNTNEIYKKAAEEIKDEKFKPDENKIYEKISEEIDGNTIDKGLWLKLFTESDGDKEKTKIRYIKERFKVLQNKEVENFKLAIKKQEEAERKILANPELVHAVWTGNVAKAKYFLDKGIKPIGTDAYKNLLLEITERNKDKIMADLIKTHRKKLNLIY